MKLHGSLNAIIVLLATALFFVPQYTEAQGNLIFNGNFDASAAGWTLTNGTFWPVGGISGNAVALDSLNPSASSDPTASQIINSLTPGLLYSVSGVYQKEKDRGATTTPATENSFGVALDGIFLFETASSTNIDLIWYGFNFFYTATSSSALLSLSSQINGTGVSYSIDNLSMQLVPEPKSLYLLGVGGIIGVLWFNQRKRNLSQRQP